jgi:hypothetical protein
MMGMGGGSEHPRAPVSENPQAVLLMSIVGRTIQPETWHQVGGPGDISEYGGLLIVKNTPKVHEEIEELLAMLRDADGKQPGAAVRSSR